MAAVVLEKSIVTRFVCKNLEDVSFIFVNLRKAKTVFGSAKLILDELGQNSIKSANGLNEAIEKIGFSIKAKLDSEGKKVFVLVLDEIDVLFYDIRGKPSDFLYKLLVIEEKLRENNYLMCIITISNHLLGNYNIDDRVKSRIGSSEVCFEPYSKDEVLKILQEVSKKAFIQKNQTKGCYKNVLTLVHLSMVMHDVPLIFYEELLKLLLQILK